MLLRGRRWGLLLRRVRRVGLWGRLGRGVDMEMCLGLHRRGLGLLREVMGGAWAVGMGMDMRRDMCMSMSRGGCMAGSARRKAGEVVEALGGRGGSEAEELERVGGQGGLGYVWAVGGERRGGRRKVFVRQEGAIGGEGGLGRLGRLGRLVGVLGVRRVVVCAVVEGRGRSRRRHGASGARRGG